MKPLPAAAGDLAQEHPKIWKAYSALGEAVSAAGPLDERSRRLVKLALAIGAQSEGAVHSHARQADRRRHRRGVRAINRQSQCGAPQRRRVSKRGHRRRLIAA